jgi:hypothetical protein
VTGTISSPSCSRGHWQGGFIYTHAR